MHFQHLAKKWLVLATLSTLSSIASANEAQPTGRLIVELHADSTNLSGLGALQGDRKSADSIDPQRWAAARGLRMQRGLDKHTHLIAPESTTDENQLRYLAHSLAATPQVQNASVEYRRYPLAEPNDPLYRGNTIEPGVQSYLYDGDYSLRAPGAWDITTGSSSAVIAVVDTGVLTDHPDLRGRSIPIVGYDFVSPDQPGDFTSANDGDGRDADPSDPGDHCSPKSSSWHGTGVASVAAANSNNAQGLAGIDWNAQLLHARALGRCGGTDADIIDAIRWSAGLPVSGLPLNETPATVVNLSIGGPTECTVAWQRVIDELNALGIPFVIAAGNERTNALRSSPANCADVITVGSNTPDGDIDSSFSNYGLKVTVAAPGRDILMATNDGLQDPEVLSNSYRSETGSSFSAAIASGAISLMQSLNPNLSPAAVRAILQQSAAPFSTDGECGSYYCGSGILNLARALQITRDGTFDEALNTEQSIISAQLSELQTSQATTGALFGYRDIRYYRVNVEDTGMLVVRSDSDADLYGYLLNDKFSVLALDDDSDSAFNFRVASLVEPGTYYFALERSVNRLSEGEATYTLTTELTTDQPAPFAFAPVSNAALNSPISSQSVQISGLSRTAIVSVTGGFYSINGNTFTRDQGQVNNGDTITVSLQSAAALNSETSMVLTIGAYATDFTVTTGNSSEPTPEPGGSGDDGGSGCTLGSTGRMDPLLLLTLAISFLALHRQLRSRKASPAN